MMKDLTFFVLKKFGNPMIINREKHLLINIFNFFIRVNLYIGIHVGTYLDSHARTNILHKNLSYHLCELETQISS